MGREPSAVQGLAPQAYIFDLDGTLIDSLEDIATAANLVMRAYGLPERSLHAYRDLIGEGVRRLVEQLAPEQSPERVAEALALFRNHYSQHLLATTRPFLGIDRMLGELRDQGLPMAVLSNKRHKHTRYIVSKLFPKGTFREVLGQRAGVPRKPDPSVALELASLLGAEPARVAFVGDTAVDICTAKAAGMQAIGVLWGYRSERELLAHGAERLIAHPQELLQPASPGVTCSTARGPTRA